jgi:hypothetical protein
VSRHTDNLERLRNKLQLRLGRQDELVIQVQHEFEIKSSSEPMVYGHLDRSTSYRKFVRATLLNENNSNLH